MGLQMLLYYQTVYLFHYMYMYNKKVYNGMVSLIQRTTVNVRGRGALMLRHFSVAFTEGGVVFVSFGGNTP